MTPDASAGWSQNSLSASANLLKSASQQTGPGQKEVCPPWQRMQRHLLILIVHVLPHLFYPRSLCVGVAHYSYVLVVIQHIFTDSAIQFTHIAVFGKFKSDFSHRRKPEVKLGIQVKCSSSFYRECLNLRIRK